MFSRAVRRPPAWRRSVAAGRPASVVAATRAKSSASSGRTPSGVSGLANSSSASAGPADSVMVARTSPVCTAAPGATATESMRPGVAATTTCSIFMDSRITTVAPARTLSPAATSTDTTVPAKGATSVIGTRPLVARAWVDS